MTIKEQRELIWNSYYKQKKELEELLKHKLEVLEIECQNQIKDLEQDCLVEYGAHKDNGVMIQGSCEYCGADLG
jgi:hypothetical protein